MAAAQELRSAEAVSTVGAELVDALIYTGSRISAAVESRLAGDRVTLRQVRVLKALEQVPGSSITDLARDAGVTKQSMQSLVRHLEQVGAIVRAGPTGSGNSARLHLTATGVAILASAAQAFEQVADEVLALLSRRDRGSLLHLLARAIYST